MPYGWMGKILDVDLTARTTSTRDAMSYVGEYMGGRAMASRIAWDEIPAGIGAYDAENHIIIATGPLTGTLAPTSGRTVMAGVSPCTYPRPWYTHSTLGGWFGPELKYAGFDAIVIRGMADASVYLEIRDDEAQLRDAGDLWGLDTRETQLVLKDRLGQVAQVLAIGPAGENLVRFATVQHAEENAAGHSGFGGVWGSKKLKAIVVRGTQGVSVANRDALLREVVGAGTSNLAPSTAVVRDGGAVTRRPICSQACAYNCFVGGYVRTTEGRLAPAHCIGNSWVTGHELEGTRYVGGGMIVPAGVNFGQTQDVALHQLCNGLGLDLWFRLVMQPWFIRCRQLGINEIRGHPIAPTDPAWFESFMHQLARREGLGDLFAEDLRRAMDELEGELPEELICLGRELEFNFGFPAHREGRFWDEEPLPFWVISAMLHAGTSRDPTIGTHHSCLLLADLMLADRELALRQFRVLSEKVWGYSDALDPSYENKAPVAVWSQNQHMLIDSLPLCDFAFPQVVRPMEGELAWRSAEDISGDLALPLRLFRAITGQKLTQRDMSEIAERAINLERAMLARAGRGRAMEEGLAAHFKLPCRADGTLVGETGFSRLLDEYYAARGWDLEFGWPLADRLKALGLDEIVPELADLRERFGSQSVG